jgi:hypothetical protein
MAAKEVIIPLIAAAAAVLSSIVKNLHAKKSKSEIVINLGNGSKITVDGSEESRERVREILSQSFGSSEPNIVNNSKLQDASPEIRKTFQKEQE